MMFLLLPVPLVLLLTTLDATYGVQDQTDTPPCDPSVVGKENLKKYFPSGPPTNLVQNIKNNGPYSYTVVSAPNAKVHEFGADAVCLSVSMPDVNSATLRKKFYVGGNLKEYLKEYTVTQKDNYLEYHSKIDTQETYKIYPLFFKNGVLITYKCCDNCKGKSLNVGIAVPDKMKDDSATKATIAEAKLKLAQHKLDGNVVPLKACPEV